MECYEKALRNNACKILKIVLSYNYSINGKVFFLTVL